MTGVDKNTCQRWTRCGTPRAGVSAHVFHFTAFHLCGREGLQWILGRDASFPEQLFCHLDCASKEIFFSPLFLSLRGLVASPRPRSLPTDRSRVHLSECCGANFSTRSLRSAQQNVNCHAHSKHPKDKNRTCFLSSSCRRRLRMVSACQLIFTPVLFPWYNFVPRGNGWPPTVTALLHFTRE